MNHRYKVSIIVNTYNGERYVDGIIKTLRPYVLEDIEIILVDDGSHKDDKTAIIFKKAFPDALIALQSNEGLAAARNKGAELATGEYLQFIDIDDSITDAKIYSQYEFAKKVNPVLLNKGKLRVVSNILKFNILQENEVSRMEKERTVSIALYKESQVVSNVIELSLSSTSESPGDRLTNVELITNAEAANESILKLKVF